VVFFSLIGAKEFPVSAGREFIVQVHDLTIESGLRIPSHRPNFERNSGIMAQLPQELNRVRT
jgi:hypothetical protein